MEENTETDPTLSKDEATSDECSEGDEFQTIDRREIRMPELPLEALIEAEGTAVQDEESRLVERLRALESGQEEFAQRLDEIATDTKALSRNLARELRTLRGEIFEDQAARSGLSVFNVLVPRMDSLRQMRMGLNEKKDERLIRQLDAILDSLKLCLYGFGFAEFRYEEGEPFDPMYMECVEYGEGPRGVVLATARPGYATKDRMVRPAGIIIADPNAEPAAEQTGHESEASPGWASHKHKKKKGRRKGSSKKRRH